VGEKVSSTSWNPPGATTKLVGEAAKTNTGSKTMFVTESGPVPVLFTRRFVRPTSFVITSVKGPRSTAPRERMRVSEMATAMGSDHSDTTLGSLWERACARTWNTPVSCQAYEVLA
jgi:hypothetical protein